MTADFGAKQSPDVEAHLAAVREGLTPAASHTEAERREMDWLCGLIDCAQPWPEANAAASAAASPRVPARPDPCHLRVTLTDDRVYTGRLHCVDADANLLLQHVVQEAGVIDGKAVGGFNGPQVLIAWKIVRKVERILPRNTAAAAAATTTATAVTAKAGAEVAAN